MSATTFAERMYVAVEWEASARRHLSLMGWAAEPFGQGQMSTILRDAIANKPTALRYMPDIVAVRGDDIRFIDAKAQLRTDTSNWSIEHAAWRADVLYWASIHPVYYAFPDLTAINAMAITNPVVHAGQGTNGSGTDFILVPKADTQHLSLLFA